ncbi:hypothetical protein [Rhizobium grahamii]|uniref:Uncharacterized protein n=1 Tax=Rhizobium grahamii CCGE 502 TaxID=990285 RepID=S3HBZ0_9HYPH|nr:hypothetical protein [Rhizobium grahamii]EPE95745.1 hypothetical protein RGCCGE502_22885 [Rhizobium grahamii CCGE 502]
MTDRPILFSSPMVRALLVGTKTQTRRLFKLPNWAVPGTLEIDDDGPYACAEISGCLAKVQTRINVGDRLWVRENAAVRHQSWHHEDGDKHQVSYLADEDESGRWLQLPTCGTGIRDGKAPSVFPSKSHNTDGSLRWQPSIHMPRWASRLTLIVTDVRVEHLQDISDDDAIAEGITEEHVGGYAGWSGRPDGGIWPNPSNAYWDLWDYINGEGAWGLNPWVVAYTFTVHRQNIDSLSKEAS